jgi:CubicO group peptidase (beta-lactamase class C family)
MAKFGQLFLDHGTWDGVRIISKGWVDRSTALYTSRLRPEEYTWWANGYGYCWWINDYIINGMEIHTYMTSGWGGQAIYIIPELDAVVVFTAGNYTVENGMVRVQTILTDYIIPSLLE